MMMMMLTRFQTWIKKEQACMVLQIKYNKLVASNSKDNRSLYLNHFNSNEDSTCNAHLYGISKTYITI